MNAALRKALAEAQLTETDVAAHLGVDPKTVRRWLSGQRPYPRHRWALATFLQIDEETLWSLPSDETNAHGHSSERVQRVYAHRWKVPREVWWDLFNSAEQEICILVYSGLFLADDSGIIDLLSKKSQLGVRIRILLGDPDSAEVGKRGEGEGIGYLMSGRVCNSIALFRQISDTGNAEIRTHSTILYNSIFCTENRMLVNQHLYGMSASRAPVIEVTRDAGNVLEETYKRSFERIWSEADES